MVHFGPAWAMVGMTKQSLSRLSISECVCVYTNTGAAHEDNQEGLHDSSHPDNPRQPKEKDDAKDVLKTRQVNPHQGAHVGRLWEDKKPKMDRCGVSGNRDHMYDQQRAWHFRK